MIYFTKFDSFSFKIIIYSLYFHNILYQLSKFPGLVFDEKNKTLTGLFSFYPKVLSWLQTTFPNEQINVSETLKLLLQQEQQVSIATTVLKKAEDTEFVCGSFRGTLYSFQKVGAKFLTYRKKALLLDDVGLGKTIESIAAAQKLLENAHIKKVIVICPASLKKKWFKEIKRFTNSTVDFIHSGSGKKIREDFYKQNLTYKIINYDLLVRDWKLICKYLKPNLYNSLLIVDEAQYIVNFMVERSKKVRSLATKALYVSALTATPTDGKLEQIFSLFKLIDWRIFGFFKDFCLNFVIKDWFGEIKGYRNLDKFRELISPYFLRRQAFEVEAELPKVVVKTYYISLNKRQQKLYKDLKKGALEEFSNEYRKPLEDLEDLPMIVKLRQACLSTQLLDPALDYSSKTEELLSFLELLSDSDDKIVVFTYFTDMVRLLSDRLSITGYKNIMLSGATTKIDDRFEVIEKFRNSKDTKVLITSDILKEGQDLQFCKYLVNFDILFSSFSMRQRMGRIRRSGALHDTVFIINFITENTIEENVLEVLTKKKDINDLFNEGKVDTEIEEVTIRDII